MAYRNNKWGGYNPQQNESEKKQQLLIQKQKSLHKMKVALDTFYNVLEPLEEYIEKSGNYPGFISKRQIYRKNIQNSGGSLENDEDLFLSNLYIFARTFHGKPEFFMKVIQEDFYKWINAVGITAENSSEELKHFLIEINNILEGNDEKIVRESVERNKNVEIDPKEMVGIFAGFQNPLNKNRWQRKELEGKKWNEIPEEDRLKGDVDLGRQEFERIKRSISISHENFRLRYFGEKRPTRQESSMGGIESSSSPAGSSIQNNSQQWTNSEIIQDVKDNPQNWRIDEVITGYDVFNKPKRENALIHNSAEVGFNGTVSNWQQLIYLASKFNQAEIAEIKRGLNITENDENRQIIESVKNDLSSWKIKLIHGNDWLVNKQAQEIESEIGHLIHPKQRFTDEEWTEIENALNSHQSWGSQIVSNILPTNFGNRQNYKLGSIKVSQPQKDNEVIGTGGILVIIGVVSVLLFGSVVVVKKRLKVKRSR